MDTKVRLTVLMSVFNGENYVSKAIDSIRCQTWRDFEFIIINDCSTDGTAEILQAYTDPRIRILENTENIGLTRSLNRGLAEAEGEYIARMDADDISLPERLEKQVAFLNRNENVGLVGSNFFRIDEKGNILHAVKQWASNEEIKNRLLKSNKFAHGSVMFRKACIDTVGPYRLAFVSSQDYDLWLRISECFDVANITEFLYKWRLEIGSISVARRSGQDRLAALAKELAGERKRHGQDRLQIADERGNHLSLEDQPEDHRAATGADIVQGYNYWARKLLVNRNFGYCFRMLLKSLGRKPFYSQTWLLVLKLLYISALNTVKRQFKPPVNCSFSIEDIGPGTDYFEHLDQTSVIAHTAVFGTDPETPAASVIIVTFNPSQKLLKRCLRTLHTQTGAGQNRFEVLLIDNNSRIAIEETVKGFNLRYIKLRENYGLSLARNVGILQARAPILIFLDDDAIPASNFIEEHLKAHQELSIHGLRGRCLPRSPSVYNCLQHHYDLGDRIIPNYIDLEGNSSFKNDILLTVGGFNPELKGAGGGEGTELSYRIINHCRDRDKLIYYPNAVIYHDYATGFIKYLIKKLRHARYREIRKERFPDIFEFVSRYERPVTYPTPPGVISRARLKIIRKSVKLLVRLFT
ncbi:MAG: glycosyltransferase [bacterium]|jgi:glycosyltransferase involved in cell wall biosynthesis|nr:glycosyltransferase [bacterium]